MDELPGESDEDVVLLASVALVVALTALGVVACETLPVIDGVDILFDVASKKPPIPAVAMTAIDPIDTIILVAVFTHPP
mgnify:CR=1 FL=1